MWLLLTNLAVDKSIKSKKSFADNQFHNISRPFDVLPNFAVTTSEMIGDYYLQAWYLRVASRAPDRLKT